MKKRHLFLFLLGILEGIYPSPLHLFSFSKAGALAASSLSYAEIINKSPQQAWKTLIKGMADKPELFSFLLQAIDSIKPLIKYFYPEHLSKIEEIPHTLHFSSAQWKQHLSVLGNLTLPVGQLLVKDKNLGPSLQQLTIASEAKEYISSFVKIATYFLLSKGTPSMLSLEQEWKKLEPSLKAYLKQKKVLIN